MAQQPIAITCSYHPSPEEHFQVERITNSIRYLPGDFLDRATINALIDDSDVTITIVVGQAI
jgi:hypothetical protein